jgi:hypothetical protein
VGGLKLACVRLLSWPRVQALANPAAEPESKRYSALPRRSSGSMVWVPVPVLAGNHTLQ